MDEHHPTPRTYTPNGRAEYKRKKRKKQILRRTIAVIVVLLVLILLFVLWIGPAFLWGSSEAESESDGTLSTGTTSAAISDSAVLAAESTNVLETQSTETTPTIDPTDWELLLVNQSHPLDSDFAPEVGIIPSDYIINAAANQFDSRAISYLTDMIEAAEKDGITLRVTSAYRDIAYQQRLFDNKVNALMSENSLDRATAEKEASTYVAIPGTSEHSTGLAVDIVSANYFTNNAELNENFENTEEFAWLSANAADYGFILRFPAGKEDITKISYEPWHYRYVGVENAKAIKEKGITLEEYLGEDA